MFSKSGDLDAIYSRCELIYEGKTQVAVCAALGSRINSGHQPMDEERGKG